MYRSEPFPDKHNRGTAVVSGGREGSFLLSACLVAMTTSREGKCRDLVAPKWPTSRGEEKVPDEDTTQKKGLEIKLGPRVGGVASSSGALLRLFAAPPPQTRCLLH
ncbi:hypothetical protein MTO96_000449 [Rhipicephalus appendiculatus]